MISLLTALTALGSISVSIYLPSLPNLAASLHASAGAIKLSLTVFLFVFAISQLAYGPVSDRYGRKRPILAGLCIYLLGSIACAGAMNVEMLIAARMLQGLGAAAGPALGRAVLRDVYSGSRLTAALSTVAAAVALSPMMGPAIGGYLQIAFGWRSCFVFLFVAGSWLTYAAYRWLPETRMPAAGGGLDLALILKNYKTLMLDQEYTAALMCGGMLVAGNFAWNAGAPFVFGMVYGFSPDRYGNIALLIGGGYVAGTAVSGFLSKRMPAPLVVYSGMGLALCGSLLLNFMSGLTAWWVVACMIVFTAGMGMVIPMSAACALSRHPEMAGAAAGLLGAIQILTGVLGTVAIGLVSSPAIAPIASILTVTSALSLAAAYVALLPFRRKMISTRERLA
jgi:DHA1 family bicyclomycin/chloramphenicol resistance-like MFS transporter